MNRASTRALAAIACWLLSCSGGGVTAPDGSAGDADASRPDGLAPDADAETDRDAEDGGAAADSASDGDEPIDARSCGNTACDDEETCESCPRDCGLCAPCAPGGMTNFVVAIGHLVDGSTEGWNRLGTYTFACTGAAGGTVSSAHWRFNQSSHRHARELTGVSGVDCTPAERDCEIRTSGTFASLPGPEETLAGTYSLEGGTVTIAWAGDLVETWAVTPHAAGLIVRLDLAGSSGFATPPTHGWAYGSNASFESAATMTEVVTTYRELPLRFEYAIWNRNAVTEDSAPFDLSSGWSQCDGEASVGQTGCRMLAADGGGCDMPADPHWCDPGESPMMYYLGDLPAGDRRNVYEFWTLCLAEGREETCYTGNSHVRPVMQAIDDGGAFHGWVGIEWSPGYEASGDYVGVFRMTDF
jgi:hypothetical protein